ncbi:MAG: tRNA pseudouridine(38-40) synthase TruA, partial [Alphaproteobacteria bacterium]|nr:tRNA pseudouridine(38-40) synthase TruA [Alphaproteobacteria bacterium]
KTINNDKSVDIHASGRTDAGVHAYNQKAHFDLTMNITVEKLKDGLNGLLPEDIHIKNIVIVDDDFHARYNAKAKEYIYRINMDEYDPIERNYVYQYNKKLDVVEMERALKYLEGTHDFTSFSKADDEKDDYVRTIVQANLIRDLKNVNKVTISFLGTGFLRYQVRNMIGTLIEIGEGKRKSEDIIKILKEKDRRKAGKTASPVGLYLKDVLY